MWSVFVLCLFLSVQAKSNEISNKPLVWFNFNNHGVFSVIDDKSRIKNRIYLENINNGDYYVGVGYSRIRNNFVQSVDNIEKIKNNLLASNEMSIKIKTKSIKTDNDVFCLFCIIDKKASLKETAKKCSNINFGVMIVRNKLIVINRNIHSTSCTDTSFQTTIIPTENDVFLVQISSKRKKIFMNDKLLLEKRNNNNDVSNWNDNYSIFIGKQTKSDSYVDIIEILMWSSIVSFDKIQLLESYPPKKKPIEKLVVKNELDMLYKSKENNNYHIVDWINDNADSIYIDNLGQNNIYVKKSTCGVERDLSKYNVKTYYDKKTMYSTLDIYQNSIKLNENYTIESKQKKVFNKKNNIRFNKIEYLIDVKKEIPMYNSMFFFISVYSKTKQLLYRYPCQVNTVRMIENSNYVKINVVDGIKIMNIRTTIIDFYIKNNDLVVEFTSEMDNHLNKDLFLIDATIVDSYGYEMEFALLEENTKIQKWRLSTKNQSFLNFDKNDYFSVVFVYFKLKDINISVKMQINVVILDFSKIKQVNIVYNKNNTQRLKSNKKLNKKKLKLIEQFYLDKNFTIPTREIHFNKPNYLMITIHTDRKIKPVLKIEKIVMEIEKRNGVHHYDITKFQVEHKQNSKNNTEIDFSSVYFEFKLKKHQTNSMVYTSNLFLKIHWKILEDTSVIDQYSIHPKKIRDSFFSEIKKHNVHTTKSINVVCCPYQLCGFSTIYCMIEYKSLILIVVFFLISFFTFYKYLSRKK